MATRRGKKTQARRGGTARGAPSLLWLLGALLVGAVLAGVVLMRDRIGASLDIPARTPATEPSPQNKSPTAKQPTPKKPTYEFYELLPEKEVMIPDAELTATARAERERPAPPPAAPTAASRYLLQAGAFSDARRAEEIKAKVALAGEFARVEAATINGKTVHRVMLGPYANAQTLESAKRKLSTADIPSVAVRAH